MSQQIMPNDKSVATYVPFADINEDLGEEAIVPVPDFLMLQYATGLQAERPQKDNQGFDIIDQVTGEVLVDEFTYSGFFTEIGKDKALDEVMVQLHVPWINIHHGSGDIVKHWMVQRPSVFIVGKGIPRIPDIDGETGIVYVRRSSVETVIYLQVVVRQLLPHYDKPFLITVKKKQSQDLLSALSHQYRVLRKAHEVLIAIGKDRALPLWSYSLPLGPSKQTDKRGQRSIHPMISLVPQEIDTKYLATHEISREQIALLKGLVEKAPTWAKAKSASILADIEPVDNSQSSGLPVDEALM